MARFIGTRKAASELEDLIRDAGDRLILVSPYLKLSKDFKVLLEHRNSKNKLTTIVFGKQELKPDEMRFLQTLRFVMLMFNEDLHAKCYLNDDKMIITSLNLYEFSMANNNEMGVLIDKNDAADTQLFEDALKQVIFIQETSQQFDFTPTSATPPVESPAARASAPRAAARPAGAAAPMPDAGKPTGYCIRTGAPIPFNLEKPMTYEAYKKWNQYADADYPEKFCHFSGEPSEGATSVKRPILKKNWRRPRRLTASDAETTASWRAALPEVAHALLGSVGQPANLRQLPQQTGRSAVSPLRIHIRWSQNSSFEWQRSSWG